MAVYKTGDFTFPPIPIILRDAQGRKISSTSPAARVQIVSVLGDNDTNLKELRKQAEIQGEPEGWPAWPGITLTALLLGALLWWLWRETR